MGTFSNSCSKTNLPAFVALPSPIGMVTGYSEVDVDYVEYICYSNDSLELSGTEITNTGTAARNGQ